MAECQSYNPRSQICRDGFVQRPFCSGSAGCMYCGVIQDKHLPACLRDQIPDHLSKPDGSPLFWPPIPDPDMTTPQEAKS